MLIQKMYGLLNVNDIDSSYIWPELKKSGYGQNEDDLLKAISDNKSKELVHYALIGLWKCGTKKSIPALKDLVYYPNQDVRTTSVVTIGVIAKGGESEFYGRLLLDPKYKEKSYPMTLLWEVGTSKALNYVRKYAQQVLNKRGKLDPDLDPRYVRDYLEKFGDKDDKKLADELNEIAEKLEYF